MAETTSKPAVFHDLHDVIGTHERDNGRVDLVAYGEPVTVEAGGRVRLIGSERQGRVVMPPTPGWPRYTIAWDDGQTRDHDPGELTAEHCTGYDPERDDFDHPTDRPNFTRIILPGAALVVWLSPVAFSHKGRRVVRENTWGPTTGKHLNYVDDGDKRSRVSGDVFTAELAAALRDVFGEA